MAAATASAAQAPRRKYHGLLKTSMKISPVVRAASSVSLKAEHPSVKVLTLQIHATISLPVCVESLNLRHMNTMPNQRDTRHPAEYA